MSLTSLLKILAVPTEVGLLLAHDDENSFGQTPFLVPPMTTNGN